MKTIPSISSALNEDKVKNLINKKFNSLSPIFYKLVSGWLIRAYSNFKDIDKYFIVVYLINKDFIFYRKNGLIIDHDTFFKDKSLEIEKINLISISNDLNIPKESARRKVAELEKIGVIRKTGKKIFIDRSAYDSIRPIITLKDLSIYISILSKILSKEKIIENSMTSENISKGIKKNFSFCWYQFYKFMFAYYFRWKDILKDFEVICIGLLIQSNAATNKSFAQKDLNIKKWREQISSADTVGLNAMSISDITGIPRPTVVRKLKILQKNNFIKFDEKKLVRIHYEGESLKKGIERQTLTINDLSEFMYRILSQLSLN